MTWPPVYRPLHSAGTRVRSSTEWSPAGGAPLQAFRVPSHLRLGTICCVRGGEIEFILWWTMHVPDLGGSRMLGGQDEMGRLALDIRYSIRAAAIYRPNIVPGTAVRE